MNQDAPLAVVSSRAAVDLELAAAERLLTQGRQRLEGLVLMQEGRARVAARSRLRGALRQLIGEILALEGKLEQLGTAA